MTPADHGARKTPAEPSTQSPPEEPVEAIADAADHSHNEVPDASHAEDPTQLVSQTTQQPLVGITANTKAEAARVSELPCPLPSHPAVKSVPETQVEQPAALRAEMCGKLAAELSAQADAHVPAHLPAQPLDQAPMLTPAVPSTVLPARQTSNAPAEASAQPRAGLDGAQTPRRAQRDIAALDELHAYVMSCGGTLDEGWTVQFQKRGNGHARPTYLPPKVWCIFFRGLTMALCPVLRL